MRTNEPKQTADFRLPYEPKQTGETNHNKSSWRLLVVALYFSVVISRGLTAAAIFLRLFFRERVA